jgi:hypothetical protein
MATAVEIRLDIDSHEEKAWAYEMDRDDRYNLILGRSWMDRHNVTIASVKKSVYIHSTKTLIRSREGRKPSLLQGITAAAFSAWIRRSKRDTSIRLYAASLADIQKALKRKVHVDPRDKLPAFLQDEYKTFLREEADKLPPNRGPSIDHAIELMKEDRKDTEVP